MGDQLAELTELFMSEVVPESLDRQLLYVGDDNCGDLVALSGKERFHIIPDLLHEKRIFQVLESHFADLRGDFFRLQKMLRDQDAQFMTEAFFLAGDHSLRPEPVFFIRTEKHPDGNGIGEIPYGGGRQDRNQIFPDKTSGRKPSRQIPSGRSS